MNCGQQSSNIFDQIIYLLEQIDDTDYCTPIDAFDGSSLGKHFRHVSDFYQCVIDGSVHGILDYGCRRRDERFERSTEAAIDTFNTLKNTVCTLHDDASLDVMADFNQHTTSKTLVKSSVGRELMYGYDHAIHHLAIIKIGLKILCPDVLIDHQMGLAPSTLSFHLSSKNDQS